MTTMSTAFLDSLERGIYFSNSVQKKKRKHLIVNHRVLVVLQLEVTVRPVQLKVGMDSNSVCHLQTCVQFLLKHSQIQMLKAMLHCFKVGVMFKITFLLIQICILIII